MNGSKKLIISEIRENIFIIERHDEGDPGKWITLNLKGDVKEDIYTGPGTFAVIDPSEYKCIRSAEKAMNDFLIYPRVVRQSDSEFKLDPSFNRENIYQRSKSLLCDKVHIPKKVLRAVSFLSKTQKLEELAVNLCDIEKSMNEIAEDLNWQPFKISIGRINEKVDNPI